MRIVIVGGGSAGIACAQTLAARLRPADNVEVVVIEKSSAQFYSVGVPRAYVEPAFAEKLFIPYDKAIPDAAAGFVKILRGIVTSISSTPNQISYRTIDNYDRESVQVETLSFDYLVIATGSTYTVPINPDPSVYSPTETKQQLHNVNREIEEANSILVIGGGAVGCEVAGEIKSKYPQKEVTILEGREKLVANSNLRESFYTTLKDSLERLGVKIILNERLTETMKGNSFEKRTVVTNKGTRIESDIQLLCGGFRPMGELVKSMNPALVNERGFIRVKDSLQFADPTYSHMFVIGDASDHKSQKMAFVAAEQGKFIGQELANAVSSKNGYAFSKPYQGYSTEACILPLGPNGGVSHLPMFGGIVLGDWTTRMLKSGDYFAGKIWKGMGVTAPQ